MKALSASGVVDHQFPCMQHQSTWLNSLAGDLRIDRITNQRCAFVFHVHTNLMRTPCVQMTQNKCGTSRRIGMQDLVIGDRRASCRWRDDCHFLAIPRIAANVGKDRLAFGARRLLRDAQIHFLIRPPRKLSYEMLMGGVIFGDDETTRSILVQSMHNAGSLNAADARKLPLAVMKQGIDQSAIGIPCRGMHHEPRIFINDNDVLILKQHLQRNVLRGGFGRNCLGQGNLNDVAHLHRIARFGGLIIAKDVLLANQLLNARPRQISQATGEPGIKAIMIGDVNNQVDGRFSLVLDVKSLGQANSRTHRGVSQREEY